MLNVLVSENSQSWCRHDVPLSAPCSLEPPTDGCLRTHTIWPSTRRTRRRANYTTVWCG